MKLILALAGGGIKGIFQLGVTKAIFENSLSSNIELTNIYTTSVGAFIAPFILSKKFDEAIDYVTSLNSINDISIKWNALNLYFLNIFIGYYNLFFKKAYYKSLDISVFNTLNNSLTKKEQTDISKKLHCQVFNINTGKEEILSGPNWINNIEASATLPLLYPAKQIGNNYYIDGGVSSCLAVENIQINDLDTHILMINFKKNLYEEEYTHIKKLNFVEYIINILAQSADLHILNDYENLIKRININNLHIISMDTKFDNAFDFNKTTIKTALDEGYKKGLEWIEKLNIK